ncbi:hypothetical protein GGR50DRAFT_637885 [Xylaria sp. CBS 124048]|nr:hypothetical protein GGR50DRAFT_637885 [Xylaria sp. CBS 124048]
MPFTVFYFILFFFPLYECLHGSETTIRCDRLANRTDSNATGRVSAYTMSPTQSRKGADDKIVTKATPGRGTPGVQQRSKQVGGVSYLS